MEKKEIWKDIKGYEGLYQISNTRKIKRIEHLSANGRYLRGKEMKFTYNNGNYQVVSLSKDGKSKNFYVDKLMFINFKQKKED